MAHSSGVWQGLENQSGERVQYFGTINSVCEEARERMVVRA